MKNKIKKYKYYILAFLIPILLLSLKFIIDKIDITGNSLLVSDMASQYVSLFAYLQDVLRGKESIFYSFNNGLGGSMYATFAYYLSSPLNLLVVFFNKSNLPLFVATLLILKVGLCGLTMSIYIKNKFNIKEKESLIFSTCYALMSYIINYHFNEMWLDGVYMLPLVMLGIDKLIKEDKVVLYTISLFITIISNFYIGYMICIFSCIYFIYELILETDKKNYKDKIVKFLIFSLLSGLSTAFLTIPTFIESRNFARPGSSYNENTFIEKLFYLLSDLFIGTHKCTNLTNLYGTYIYPSIFIIYMCFLYFFNDKISKREKTVSFVVLILLIISSILSPLQYIWHAFSSINSFNNRFSFVITFYMIMLAAKSYKDLSNLKLENNLIFLIVYIFVGLILLINRNIDINNILISLTFIIIYMLIIKNIKQNLFKYILLVFVIIELFINLYISFLPNKDTSMTFSEFYDSFSTKLNDLDLNYRFDNNHYFTGLDGLLFNYSGITNYLSTNTNDSFSFFYNVGYSAGSIAYLNELTNTKVIDSLLGIKYNYSTLDSQYYYLNKSINLKTLDDDNQVVEETLSLYENKDALSLGYMIEHENVEDNSDPFEYQNELIKKFSGIDKDSLIKLDYQKVTDNQYVINTNSNKIIYIKINYNRNSSFFNKKLFDVYIDGNEIEGRNFSVFYYLNEDNKEQMKLEINIVTDDLSIDSIDVYTIDENVFKEQIDTLKENQITNIIKNKNRMTFQINNNSADKTLLLTIPYSKGFKVYVDGKKTSYKKVVDMFIGIDIDKGIHDIEIVYYPTGLKCGIVISFVSILIFIICQKSVNNIK